MNSEAHISLINITSLGNYRFLLATFILLESSQKMPFKEWNITFLEGNNMVPSEIFPPFKSVVSKQVSFKSRSLGTESVVKRGKKYGMASKCLMDEIQSVSFSKVVWKQPPRSLFTISLETFSISSWWIHNYS